MTSRRWNTNRDNHWEKLLIITLICVVCVGTALKLFYWQNFTFDKFIDRDIFRGIYPDGSFWIEGSELSGGGRTPGGAMNVLMYLLYRLSFHQVIGVYFWFCTFHFLGILWVSLTLKPYFGKVAAWTSAALMSVNFMFFEQFIVLWNPTFSFVFYCGVFSLTIKMFIEKRYEYLPLITALIAISSQLHLSNIVLLPVIFLAGAMLKFKWPWRSLLWSLAAFVFLYSPFLWREMSERAIFFHSWNTDPTLSVGTYFQQYLKVFLNYFSVIFFSENPGLQWSHRTSFNDSVFFSFRFILVAISLLPLSWALFALFKRQSQSVPLRVLKSLFLSSLVLLLPALLVSYSNQEISYRRFLWVEPFFVSLCAIGFAQMASRFVSLKSKKGVFASCALILLYSWTQVIYVYANESATHRQESYFFKKELVDVARHEFQLTDYEIEHQIGLISKEDYNGVHGDYIIKTSHRNDGSGLKVFLGNDTEDPPMTALSDQCVFAIRDKASKDDRSVKYTDNYLQQLLDKEGLSAKGEPAQITKIFHGRAASFFSYKKTHNNCVHFFTNYYYIPEKRIIEEMLASEDPFSVISENADSKHYFAFRHDVDQTDYYFLMSLEMHGDFIGGALFMDTREFAPFESLPPFEKEGFISGAQLILKPHSGQNRYALPLFHFSENAKNLFSSPLFFKLPKPPPGLYTLEIEVPLPNGQKISKPLSPRFSTYPSPLPGIQ